MECPKCKYANPNGALYCQLCYEVLLQSAAKTHIHAAHRNRQRERNNALDRFEIPLAPILSGGHHEGTIRWNVVVSKIGDALVRNRKGLLLGAAAVLSLTIGVFCSMRMSRLSLFGTTLSYKLEKSKEISYLVGFRNHIQMRSESEGRLDTPFPEIRVNETGKISIRTDQDSKKAYTPFRVEARQWIKTLWLQPQGTQTLSIDSQHSSLVPATLLIDKSGILIERRGHLTARIGRSLPFAMPRFPKESLKKDKIWTEKVEWIDTIDEWKIYWHGQLEWRFMDYVERDNRPMAHLTYTARLKPNLWEAPGWAGKISAGLLFSGHAKGEVFWDVDRHAIAVNHFSYQGTVKVPVDRLQKIPWEHRVGRLMATGPGYIVMDFNNQIDLQKM